MLTFISWYLTITLLGWLAFPLVWRLFPALADRGYSLTRAAGLLIWAYTFWLLGCLGMAQNDISGLLFSLAILIGLGLWAAASHDRDQGSVWQGLQTVFEWVKTNLRYIGGVEILFLVSFIFLALMRATGPEVIGTEKPMELAFINAILRSPSFPPNDPWLSGYSISYYYFGYVMTAMLARLTATPGSVAFNLMTALVFAMGATGAYGILHNLLALRRAPGTSRTSRLAWLGPLFLLILGNVEGFLEILHKRGLFWKVNADGVLTSRFWTWLDMKELSQPPTLPPLSSFLHPPERYWWWWRASRVLQDYDLVGGFREVIDEFPFFSFLLGDLHPHVLAIPFGLLAVAAALNLYLGGWRGKADIFDPNLRLYIRWEGFAFIALLLGGLSFLNTWDILIGAALIGGAYLLARVRAKGWDGMRFFETILFLVPLGAASLALYLPFYIGFSSQAGGLLPNVIDSTRGMHLWVMFGTLLVPLLAYLIYRSVRGQFTWKHWLVALGIGVGFVAFLWLVQWPVGLRVAQTDAGFVDGYLSSQGMSTPADYFRAGNLRRLQHIASLITLLAIFVPVLALLAGIQKRNQETDLPEKTSTSRALPFVTLLILLGTLLVLGPEFLYLRDQFGTRMNTIFKFYYQAWMLWSLAAAFGTAELLRSLRSGWGVVWRIGLVLILIVGLAYPLLGVIDRFGLAQLEDAYRLSRTQNDPQIFRNALAEWGDNWSLDGAAYLRLYNTEDAAAMDWLSAAPLGVVAEAVGGSYTGYARMSTYSGQPTVIGWLGHEGQWRGGYEEQGSRQSDIQSLYETRDWTLARQIIDRYQITYIVVGPLETQTYSVYDAKFQQNLTVVFQEGNTTIYATSQP